MGSPIEINDTLKISKERGFPDKLTREEHLKKEFTEDQFAELEFEFRNPEERLYPRPPTRAFLVEEINGKWLYWGHAIITEQTIDSKKNETRGRFKIIKIYDSVYQKLATINESPEGKSYLAK